MKWQGTAEFIAMQNDIVEEVRVSAARACMEAAKDQRDRALEGFWTYRIRLITGRSRALYAVKPGAGMFQQGATKVTVDVGYSDWPDSDAMSGGDPIAFYPWFLNYGTVYMPARPFHTSAISRTEPEFYKDAMDAMHQAYAKASHKYAGFES